MMLLKWGNPLMFSRTPTHFPQKLTDNSFGLALNISGNQQHSIAIKAKSQYN